MALGGFTLVVRSFMDIHIIGFFLRNFLIFFSAMSVLLGFLAYFYLFCARFVLLVGCYDSGC